MNLSNSLQKSDTMLDKPRILSLFPNSFDRNDYSCMILYLNHAIWAEEHQKFEYAQEVIGDGLSSVKQGNKHIKLAYSSEEVWETVKQYQFILLASDSED